MSEVDPKIELFRIELAMLGSELELDALAAAFALVVCSDGTYMKSEARRWDELMPASGETAAVREAFDGYTRRLMADFKDARRRAHDALHTLRANKPEATRRVLHAARMAVVADNKVDEREEEALRAIATALGLDPDAA